MIPLYTCACGILSHLAAGLIWSEPSSLRSASASRRALSPLLGGAKLRRSGERIMATKRDGYRRKELRKLRIAAVAACFLFAAEVFAVCHALDFKAHANNEPCKICLSMAGFVAGANVGHAIAIPVIPQSAECDTAYAVLLVSHDTVPHRARGPPLAS